MNAPLSNPPNLLLSLPLATSLFCSATHAGAHTTASFTVPFAFSANNQDVPAGSYNVQLQDRFLYLRSLKSTKTVSQLADKATTLAAPRWTSASCLYGTR
jgi:hypothetical protein